MKKSWIIILLILTAGGGGAAYYFTRPKPLRWQEVTVEPERFLLSISESGTIQPENKVSVISPISGRIERILVDEGARVKRGQIIAWMSSTDRAALLDSARSQGGESVKEWMDVYKPTPIISPSAGMIISKNVVVGQTVNQQTVLFDLSDRLIVMADVDETDLGKIRIGQNATIKVDSFPEIPLKAKVSRIAHQSVVKNSINIYPVQLETEAMPPEFRAGLTASVYFVQLEIENALVLPTWVAEGREHFTMPMRIKATGENPEKGMREVKFGASNGQKIVVLEGLAAGESVMVREQRVLSDGKSSNPFGMGMGGRRGSSSGSGGRR